MKPFKKVIAIVLALVLITSVVGCTPISMSKQFQDLVKKVAEQEETSVSKLIRKLCLRYFLQNNIITDEEVVLYL